MMASPQDEEALEFVSPHLRARQNEEIVTVAPKDPGRKTKVYIIRKEAGLTGRNYVYCSSCQHRAFKLFRNVTRASAPPHLKRFGRSDHDLLRFCRTCWYGVTVQKQAPEKTVDRPYFERSPLGITDQRACFGWHFIQRDFVRKKFRNDEAGSESEKEESKHDKDNNGQKVKSLVTVVGRDGNDFINKDYNANLFDYTGKEVSSLGNESGYLSNDSPTNDNFATILSQIHKDHDYAPTMQREVEVTTTAASPDKIYHHGNAFQKPWKVQRKKEIKHSKTNFKASQSKQQTANKLLKKAVLFDGSPRAGTANFVKMNMPVDKVEEELKTKREQGESVNPTHLSGLKATADNGQALPGLICPLCCKHTVKSYSVWTKENAPQKIMHLFKDGVTLIRACRKCVPYPITRDRTNKNPPGKASNPKNIHSQPPVKKSETVLSIEKKKVNGGNVVMNISVNGISKAADGNTYLNLQTTTSKMKGSKSKVGKSEVKTLGVKLSKINSLDVKSGMGNKTLKQPRNNNVIDSLEVAAKKAKLEENKLKLQRESGVALTGLECFESLQAEDGIAVDERKRGGAVNKEDSGSSGKSEDGSPNDIKGRPLKQRMSSCDKCSSHLGKSFKTVKQSKCPKKYMYFFKENRTRRSMRICSNCNK